MRGLIGLAVLWAGCAAAKKPAEAPAAPPPEPTVEPAPVAEVVPDDKRGAAYHFCGWPFNEGAADLEAMVPGLSWYYNWSSRPLSCSDGHGVGTHPLLAFGTVEFVPMAWGLIEGGAACDDGGACFRVDERSGGEPCAEVCGESDWSFDPAGACYACYHDGVSRQEFLDDVPTRAKYLLGYNEPNFKEQANLTPQVAADGWRHLEWVADQRDLKLVGPATNFCDPTPGVVHPGACIEAINGDRMFGLAWLERFYDACTDCRIDHQAVHAYSCGGVHWMVELMKTKAGMVPSKREHCSNSVQDEDEFGMDCGGNFCKACSPKTREHFSKPVWLTEFAPPQDDCKTDEPAALEALTIGFMSQELPKLREDPYVFRYAWFMPKVSMPNLHHVDLLVEDEAGVLNAQGRRYFER